MTYSTPVYSQPLPRFKSKPNTQSGAPEFFDDDFSSQEEKCGVKGCGRLFTLVVGVHKQKIPISQTLKLQSYLSMWTVDPSPSSRGWNLASKPQTQVLLTLHCQSSVKSLWREGERRGVEGGGERPER